MISGYLLIAAGWERAGSTYTKGDDKIVYDGCNWYLNNKIMKTLPDYSEYLKKPGMLEYIEKEWLDKPEIHDLHSGIINDIVRQFKIVSVIEIGCGTGNVAKRLDVCDYFGIDANQECIKLASEKNPDKLFHCADIRTYTPAKAELVFCFGVLKHFGLNEWLDVFKRIASFGEYFIFDIPIAGEVKDDGTEYHHVWMNNDRIVDECRLNKLKILKREQMNKDEICFITKRI